MGNRRRRRRRGALTAAASATWPREQTYQTYRLAVTKDEPAARLVAARDWLLAHRVAFFWLAGLGVAALAPAVMRKMGIFTPVDDGLSSLDFDLERVALIDHVLAALLGACVGAVLLRQRLAAWLGGIAYYVFTYLRPFVTAALHPGLSPAGLPLVLDPAGFRTTLLTLLGLGIVFAGFGAALGGALGDILTVPLLQMARLLTRFARNHILDARTLVRPVGLLLCGLLLLAAFNFAVRGVTDVLTYGPTNDIYVPLAPTSSGASPIQHGTVLQGSYISRALNGLKRTYYVYLPPSYTLENGRHYPTLYLLHGSPGDPHNWMGSAQAPTTTDALEAQNKMRETILVSPDGGGVVHGFSQWANSFDGRQNMEDAIVKELVPYIDAHYRTIPDAADRAIAGLSEGGFGAVNIALHHPDVFSVAASESGYFEEDSPQIFGSGPASASYRQYNSPSQYVFTPSGSSAAHHITFVICVGTLDGTYYTDGLAFVRDLKQIGAHVTLIQRTGGHSWPNWAAMFGQAEPLMEPPTITASH